MQGRLVAVDIGDELADTALIAHRLALLLPGALVCDRDAQTRVQEGLLAHARVQHLIVIDKRVEHLGVGLEGDGRAGVVGRADDPHLLRDMAAGEAHLIDLPVLVHLHHEPLAQGVDD